MTGAEFYTYLQQKYDKAYSSYLDTTKANRLIKETMYRVIDRMYHDLSFEKEGDELIGLIIKDKSLTPAAGICTLNASITTPTPPANEVPYYMHIMRVLAKYETAFIVTASSSNTLTSVQHTLRKGDTIKNGSTLYTVTKVYNDTFMAKTSAGVYATATGTYYNVFDREMKQMSSTRKAGSFHKANIITPRYEFLNNGTAQNRSLRLTPAPITAVIDYVRVPPLDIDVANTSTELLDYYSQKFLYHLMDECVMNFATQTKDQPTRQMAMQDVINNP